MRTNLCFRHSRSWARKDDLVLPLCLAASLPLHRLGLRSLGIEEVFEVEGTAGHKIEVEKPTLTGKTPVTPKHETSVVGRGTSTRDAAVFPREAPSGIEEDRTWVEDWPLVGPPKGRQEARGIGAVPFPESEAEADPEAETYGPSCSPPRGVALPEERGGPGWP